MCQPWALGNCGEAGLGVETSLDAAGHGGSAPQGGPFAGRCVKGTFMIGFYQGKTEVSLPLCWNGASLWQPL